MLVERASAAQTAMAVTHGGFRRILADRLETLAWRGNGSRSYENWSIWSFSP